LKCTLKNFEWFYGLLDAKKEKITDDHSGSMFDVAKHLLTCPSVIVLMPSERTAFVLSCVNSILYEAHLLTTDKKNVMRNTLSATRWVKENTVIERFISKIPVISISTMMYSESIGMEKIGIIKDGYLKDGKRIDIAVVGCSVNNIIRRLSKWQQQL